MPTAQQLLELDRELTTEEIQRIRVELGMNPKSDVIEVTTGGCEERAREVNDKTHWDENERLK